MDSSKFHPRLRVPHETRGTSAANHAGILAGLRFRGRLSACALQVLLSFSILGSQRVLSFPPTGEKNKHTAS